MRAEQGRAQCGQRSGSSSITKSLFARKRGLTVVRAIRTAELGLLGLLRVLRYLWLLGNGLLLRIEERPRRGSG